MTARIHVHVDDALEKRMKALIKDKYENPYGAIRKVIEEALNALLTKEGY